MSKKDNGSTLFALGTVVGSAVTGIAFTSGILLGRKKRKEKVEKQEQFTEDLKKHLGDIDFEKQTINKDSDFGSTFGFGGGFDSGDVFGEPSKKRNWIPLFKKEKEVEEDFFGVSEDFDMADWLSTSDTEPVAEEGVTPDLIAELDENANDESPRLKIRRKRKEK